MVTFNKENWDKMVEERAEAFKHMNAFENLIAMFNVCPEDVSQIIQEAHVQVKIEQERLDLLRRS